MASQTGVFKSPHTTSRKQSTRGQTMNVHGAETHNSDCGGRFRLINQFLDSLPRTRLGVLGREVPTFRTCGIIGFYFALIVLFGGGLLAGRSLLVLSALALVSGLSFFAYTYLRKWITGREELVLLEHVWFALGCNALVLSALHEPVLSYLDVVCIALCPFLAAGRIGCTLVGCCHGNPSSLGITYPEACACDGFDRHLLGIRLLPVPFFEALGLLAIAVVGSILLPFAQSGKVFAWYLLAYSIMRFGLEGIRGDCRPHFLGLSQACWMSLVEFGFALYLDGGKHTFRSTWIYAAFGAVLALSLAYRWWADPRRRLLDSAHLHEASEALETILSQLPGTATIPKAFTSSCRLTAAASPIAAGPQGLAHVFFSLPEPCNDLRLLCELAARTVPGPWIQSAQFTEARVLHLLAHYKPSIVEAIPVAESARQKQAALLYGIVVRRSQTASRAIAQAPTQYRGRVENCVEPPAVPSPPSSETHIDHEQEPWYFADVRP
jgi:hypothetical protein